MDRNDLKKMTGWSRPQELAPDDKVEVLFRDSTDTVEGFAYEFGWNCCDIKAYRKL